MYVQVNIGRNYNTSNRESLDQPPLTFSQNTWKAFVADISASLRYYAKARAAESDVQVHFGEGEWKGVVEQSAHISLYSIGGFDLDGLRAELREHRFTYSQDAIALVVGSELVTA